MVMFCKEIKDRELGGSRGNVRRNGAAGQGHRVVNKR